MNRLAIWMTLILSTASAQEGRGPIQRSLDSMQQLRSLIPERNWEQMFNISIHQDEIEQQIKTQDSAASVQTVPGQDFFLFATTSGETIRVMDLYNQFQFSPYWHIPQLLEYLENVEKTGIDSDIIR